MFASGLRKARLIVAIDSLSDVKRYVNTATSLPADSLRGSVRVAGEVVWIYAPNDGVERGSIGPELAAEGRRIAALNGKFALSDSRPRRAGTLNPRADGPTAGAVGFTSIDADARLDSSGLAVFDASLATGNGVYLDASRNSDCTRATQLDLS